MTNISIGGGGAIPQGFQDLIEAPTVQVDANDYMPASSATSTAGAVQTLAPAYNATTDATTGAVVANAAVTAGGPTTPLAASTPPPTSSSTTTAAAKAAADKKTAAAKATADKAAADKAAADKATTAKIAAATVTVKSGDTLSAIAKAHGVDLATIESLNKDTIPNPNMIKPGQTIKLAAGADLKAPSPDAATKPTEGKSAATKPAAAAVVAPGTVLTDAQKKSLTDEETKIATLNDGINHDINAWFTKSITPGETETDKATLTSQMQNATLQQQTLVAYLQQIQTLLASGHT